MIVTTWNDDNYNKLGKLGNGMVMPIRNIFRDNLFKLLILNYKNM